jgi:hypothetical protein
MADPAEILQQLYISGFELQTFEQFPRAIGVVRADCVALLVPGGQGLQVLGSPGWLIAGNLGVLTTVNGAKVFQYKSQIVEATPDRIRQVKEFEADLRKHLAGKPQ